jgi:hypothetical protein
MEDKNTIHYKKIAMRIQEMPHIAQFRPGDEKPAGKNPAGGWIRIRKGTARPMQTGPGESARAGLELDKIRLRRAIDQVLGHGGFGTHVAADVKNLVAQIARV